MNSFKRNTIDKVITIILIMMIFSSVCTAYADNIDYLVIAKSCKQYLVDNSFHYHKGGKIYPIDVAEGKTVDCSGYVGWTVFEYQEGDFECQNSKWFLKTAKLLYNGDTDNLPDYTQGWQGIKGYENFQPGDILCYPHHVHIYYGDDHNEEDHYLVLNAGGNTSLKDTITSIRGSYFRRAEYAIRLP